MGDIVRKIELFNAAYRSAWSQFAYNRQLTTKQRSRVGPLLRDVIQRLIKAGKTEPEHIADEAIAGARAALEIGNKIVH